MRDHHLRERRLALGWSQYVLADRAGVSQSSVSCVERGRYDRVLRPVRIALAREERTVGRGNRWRKPPAPINNSQADWNRRQALADALPHGAAQEAYFDEMASRVWELWEETKFEEADILIAFVPPARAAFLLKELEKWLDAPAAG
jgi:transcriptional regulator with XRE-family HTH domain